MLSNDTIKTIKDQIPKVTKVINISNHNSVMFHIGSKKVIEITLNQLDLFNVRFLIGIGKCYNSDKSKESINNVDLYGFAELFKK